MISSNAHITKYSTRTATITVKIKIKHKKYVNVSARLQVSSNQPICQARRLTRRPVMF